jgi:hypothetical protein
MSDNQEQVINSKEPLSSQQKKKSVHIEMFRAGAQISSTGQKLMFTEEDLDQVVGTYVPGDHEAPLIIGHDQTDGTPALGWVKNLWRKGKALWGNVELTPKAEKLIRDGVFKKVSSSFYLPEAETNPYPGKLALRHLGLVSIPAVKGLTAFSEGELNNEKIINLTPEEGDITISFKEALETNNFAMTKKKNNDVVKEVSVDQTADHAEGGMTVNINIGGGKPSVYDDSGNEVSETGAPADYKMEYAADEETDEEMAPEAESEAPEGEGEGDDMGLEDEAPTEEGMGDEEAPAEEGMGDEEAPTEEGMGDEEGEGNEPAKEDGEEDISGEMENNDKKIASLAAEYDEDELFQALALKKQAGSMMEKGASYGEMPEGLKKHMEEKEGKGEDDEEKKEEADHAEEVVDNAEEKEEEKKEKEEADHAEEVVDSGEGCGDMEEEKKKKEEDEDEKKSDMSEKVKEEKKEEKADHAEEAAPVATESLDHSESAIGDQSVDNLNARVAELEEELNKQRKLAREKEISSFAEGLYESGKLTEQVVPKGDLVRFMETLNNKNSVNFSETGKASQFDFMRGVLDSLPSMVSFEEFATPTSAPKKSKSVEPNASGYAYDPNTANVHAEALSYAEENDCDYLTAVKFVINNN